MFEVILSPESLHFYQNADRPLAKKLTRCFEHLEHHPHRHSNIKQLKGEWRRYYRFRVGDWRVIYRVDDTAQQVLVASIAHRREVYE